MILSLFKANMNNSQRTLISLTLTAMKSQIFPFIQKVKYVYSVKYEIKLQSNKIFKIKCFLVLPFKDKWISCVTVPINSNEKKYLMHLLH